MNRILCVSLVLLGARAFAGLTVTSEVLRDGGVRDVMVMTVEGTRARMELGAHGYMLWDSAAKHMTMVLPKDQAFLSMDEGQLSEAAAKMDAMKSMMKAQLEKMPAEQRAKYEQMLQKMQPPPAAPAVTTPWVFKATGAKQKVNGWDCAVHTATRGDDKMEVCTVAWAKSPITKDDVKQLRPFAEFGKSMQKAFGASSNPDMDLTSQLDAFPGYPVHVVHGTFETSLKSVSREKVSADRFEVPAGFKERTPFAAPH